LTSTVVTQILLGAVAIGAFCDAIVTSRWLRASRLEILELQRAAERTFQFPRHCYFCGAFLMGGATKHANNCEVKAIIAEMLNGGTPTQ
jgi:hypothetical protein